MSDDIPIGLLDWIAGEPAYDPACERVETAVKAIWLLYRRAKWNLLEVAGLPREQIEPLLAAYDLTIDAHYLTNTTAAGLLLFARRVGSIHLIRLLSACFWLIGKYRQRKLTGVGVTIR